MDDIKPEMETGEEVTPVVVADEETPEMEGEMPAVAHPHPAASTDEAQVGAADEDTDTAPEAVVEEAAA